MHLSAFIIYYFDEAILLLFIINRINPMTKSEKYENIIS